MKFTMEDLDEWNEGTFEDNVNYLRTAYKQVQYVFDELGSGFDKLTAARIGVMIGRLNCAKHNMEDAAENLKMHDEIIESREGEE